MISLLLGSQRHCMVIDIYCLLSSPFGMQFAKTI
jgi:hypothetical protein